MIKSLHHFELYKLLESIVEIDDSFVDKLKEINHPISYSIIGMLDDYNKIDTHSDELKNIEKVIASDNPDEVIIKRINKPLNPKADILKVGRLIRKISDTFSQEDVATFVNAYKANSLKKSIEPIIVRGESVNASYLDSNYESERGDMEHNCMKSKTCQPFLSVYSKNPDKVGAVVILNNDSKIKARALIWNTDQGDTVMDKIYSTEPQLKEVLHKWADKNNIAYRAKDDSKPINSHIFMKNGVEYEKEYTITLDNYQFNSYPYLDTFLFLTEDGVLHNTTPKDVDYRELRSPIGSYIKVRNKWFNNRKAKTIEEVKEFMEMVNCDWYDIHDDLSVSAYSKIEYTFENLVRIPINFKFIKGDVLLNNNRLVSLEGLPTDIIYGQLDVSNNNLNSLKGSPKVIKGDFSASDCFLTTLSGGPEVVDGNYTVVNNDLRNLDDLAKSISKDLYIWDQRSNAKFNDKEIRRISHIGGSILSDSTDYSDYVDYSNS